MPRRKTGWADWTTDDLAELANMASEGLTPNEIARTLERNYNDVASRLSDMGMFHAARDYSEPEPDKPAARACNDGPRTPGKILAMSERLARGEELWHADDHPVACDILACG